MANKQNHIKNEKVGGSLVVRILVVCLALVVLPLIIFSFVRFRQTLNEKIKDNLRVVAMVGETSEAYFDEWINLHKKHLTAMSDNVGPFIDFTSMAEDENLESYFYVVKRPDGTFICASAANKERVGMENIFSEQLSKMPSPGTAVFAAYDPLTHLNQIFIVSSVKKNEYFVIGKLVERWIERFREIFADFFQYGVTFIEDNGTLLATDDPSFALEAREVLTLDTIQEKQWQVLTTIKKYVAVRIPFKDTNFALFVDFSKEEIERTLIGQTLLNLFAFVFVIIFVGGGLLWFLSWKMMFPLKHLYFSMREVSQGNLHVRYDKQRWGFEINQVGESFNETVNQLVTHMKSAQDQKVKTEMFRKELAIAREIQSSLFPKQMPSFPSLEIASLYIPAKEVSGDFYDLFPIEDKLMLVIADASGKGVSSALYALSVRSLLRSTSFEHHSLGEIVKNTNQLFCLDTQDSGFFVTAWVGIYDRKTKKLEYNSCGHHPAFLRKKDGTLEELSTTGMALGALTSASFTSRDVQLEKGDLLFIYTDGLIEAQNPQQQFFGNKRLVEMLKTHSTLAPQRLVDVVVQELDQFTQEEVQFDDITLLVIQIV